MRIFTKIVVGVSIMFLASVTGTHRAQDTDKNVDVSLTVEGEKVTIVVEPWRATLERGHQRLTWTCSVNGNPIEKPFRIQLRRRNAFDGPREISSLRPATGRVKSGVEGVFYYKIFIPHPTAGRDVILIDPEYERNR